MQATVGSNIAFAVIGAIYDSGPSRVYPGVLNSGDATQNVVGRVFTVATGGDASAAGVVAKYQAGGAGATPAILVNSKEYSSGGTTAGGALAATLTLRNGEIGNFLTMGSVVVALGAAAAVGDAVKYNTTTGVILTGAPGAGEAALTGARVVRWANAAAGLAVIEITA